jgi:diaminopimelate epimerase
MRFVKMHGLGNDYVYFDALAEPGLQSLDWPTLARSISDRHRGVGGDGVILICPPDDDSNHTRMRTFNADGSEAEACGNGTRCVARYLSDRLGIAARPLRIESGARVFECEPMDDGMVRVAMAQPGLEPADCHLVASELAASQPPTILINGQPLKFHPVSMGNPHAVVFVKEYPWLGSDLAAAIRRFGPEIENHPAFGQRINAHLVEIHTPKHATVHTWERGAGPTMACGTGACAVLVAAVLCGVLDNESVLTLPGGDLTVSWNPATSRGDNIVRQTGPAEFVFDGHWLATREGILH